MLPENHLPKVGSLLQPLSPEAKGCFVFAIPISYCTKLDCAEPGWGTPGAGVLAACLPPAQPSHAFAAFALVDKFPEFVISDLPDVPVDIIVSALDSHENAVLSSQAWYASVVRWANQSKAPVLALDPPTDGAAVGIKWSLSLALPLNYSDKCGQVYLCDLAIPSNVWKTCGIKYTSPFGHKFCVALHPGS